MINSGVNSPSWKGGISRAYKNGYHNAEYKKWRKNVFEKDKYACVFCGSKENIEAHHFFRFSYFPNFRLNVWNGLTLCHKCHQTTKPKDRKMQLILI
jgi:5-methylcytosine-specific restriction endonuclease McrA